ncbi:MAG: hypothetical protein JEZ06_21425 [Anaerolineaceae bacterium]|nr:hypothetical protein [Anaerolineaceae bacterium]
MLSDLPAVVSNTLLPLIGAAAAGYIVYLLLRRFVGRTKAELAISEIAGLDEKNTVRFGTQEHKLRLAFRKLKINSDGKELYTYSVGRFVAGAAIFLFLLAFGMPMLACMIGFFGGFILLHNLVQDTWTNVRMEIEEELPSFMIGLTSAIKVTNDVLTAVEDECKVLNEEGPLREWLETRFLMECKKNGHASVRELVLEADDLTSSLGICITMIGRMWETGGSEWQRSFDTASTNLQNTLDSRIGAHSASKSAKGTSQVLALLVALMILFMNAMFGSAAKSLLVQVIYGGSIVWMLIGNRVISKMVEEVM